MNKISNLFARHWRNLHLFSIIVIIAFLIMGQAIVGEYLKKFSFTIFRYPYSVIKQTYLDLQITSEDNRALNETVTELSNKISLYEEIIKENIRLREITGFDSLSSFSLIPTKIVSISGDFIPVSAVINKGEADSIYMDMAVINQQGLVGKVLSTSDNSAVVQFLTDPANRVAARLTSSREMGIIKYSAKEGMLLDNFPIQGEVSINDTIISSGLGGVYPAGLKVGIVKSVERLELEAICKIKVEPLVNFFSIDELFIVKEDNQ